MLISAPTAPSVKTLLNPPRVGLLRFGGPMSAEECDDVRSDETSVPTLTTRLQTKLQNVWQRLKIAFTPAGFQLIKQWMQTKIRQVLGWLDAQQRQWFPHSQPLFVRPRVGQESEFNEPTVDPLISESPEHSDEVLRASLKHRPNERSSENKESPLSTSGDALSGRDFRVEGFASERDVDEDGIKRPDKPAMGARDARSTAIMKKKRVSENAFTSGDHTGKISALETPKKVSDLSASNAISPARKAGQEVTEAVAGLLAKNPCWQADLKMVNWDGVGDNLHWLLRDITANTQRAANLIGFPDTSPHMTHTHLRYLASRFHQAVTRETHSVTPAHLKTKFAFTMPPGFDESPEQTAQRIGNALTRYFENNPESEKAHARRPWGDMIRALPPSLQNLRDEKVFSPLLTIASPFFSQFIPDPSLLRIANHLSDYLRGL